MSDSQLVATFFAQIAFILLACRLVGLVARRVGQPQVMAEMIAGFLLGPSLFGWLAPNLQAIAFPPASLHTLYIVSQVGLVLYMFCVGLEFRSELILRDARKAASVSIAGIVVPFAFGAGLALMLMRMGGFFAPGVTDVHAVLFTGAAMAITAFPVLARIIYERGIAGTAIGSLTLAAGALDDAAAWIILAIVLGSFTGTNTLALIAALGGLLYAAIVLTGGRRLFAYFDAIIDERGAVPSWMLSTILAILAAGAWFTDRVGIHSVFGAFVLGAAVPSGRLSRELQRAIAPITTALIVPLFFVYSGLNTRTALIDSASLWFLALLTFVAACAGKGIACFFAARVTGASSREALSVAVLMNARGMMELILLNIGLQRGLITPTLFTIFVLMTFGTTLMAGPLFSLVNGRVPEAVPDRDLRVPGMP